VRLMGGQYAAGDGLCMVCSSNRTVEVLVVPEIILREMARWFASLDPWTIKMRLQLRLGMMSALQAQKVSLLGRFSTELSC
jgi:hypothetical protein